MFLKLLTLLLLLFLLHSQNTDPSLENQQPNQPDQAQQTSQLEGTSSTQSPPSSPETESETLLSGESQPPPQSPSPSPEPEASDLSSAEDKSSPPPPSIDTPVPQSENPQPPQSNPDVTDSKSSEVAQESTQSAVTQEKSVENTKAEEEKSSPPVEESNSAVDSSSGAEVQKTNAETNPQEKSYTQIPNKVQILELYKMIKVVLEPNNPKIWKLTLGQINTNDDLFITVQSPVGEPLQQPLLAISTSDAQSLKCSQAQSQFMGVCRLGRNILRDNLTLLLTTRCVTKCHLTIEAGFQPRVKLSLEKALNIKASPQTGRQFELDLKVPLEMNFTELAIVVEITDFSSAVTGLELFANLGNENTVFPSSEKYDAAGESIFWGGEGLFFSKSDFSQENSWVKIYLSLGAGMEVKVTTKLIKNNEFSPKLGTGYFDYTLPGEPRKYCLDISKEENIKGKILVLGFVVYAGAPRIKVALDPEFKVEVNGMEAVGTITYMLTESYRKYLMMNNTIYFMVSSSGNSDYYFYSDIRQDNYLMVKTNVPYYNKMDSGEVFNYFFHDVLPVSERKDPIRTYTVKVHTNTGDGTFGVRHCSALQTGQPISECLITSLQQLNSKEMTDDFKIIPATYKATDEYFQLIFKYNLTNCQRVKLSQTKSQVYYCSFHVVAANQKDSLLEYTLSVTKRAYSSLLNEGQIVRDSVNQGEHLYYRFGLTSLDQVSQVTFFLTPLEGEIFILGSTSDPFPQFSSQGVLKTSSNNRMVFGKEELSKNFYLTVSGNQFSEYTLGVSVSRDVTGSKSFKSTVKLLQGVSQDYILGEGEEEAFFEVSVFEDITVTVETIELVGSIRMQLTNDGHRTPCLPDPTLVASVSCKIALKKGEKVTVRVSGQSKAIQRFMIAFYKSEECLPYSLNLPLYKELPPGVTSCISFYLTKEVDLELTTSLPIPQLLEGALQIQTCINGRCLSHLPARSYEFSKQLIGATCERITKNTRSCPIQVKMISNSTETLHFGIVMRQRGLDILLFDGIAEKVSSSSSSSSHFSSQKFYYEVGTHRNIRIFFTSPSGMPFILMAQFVSQEYFKTFPDVSYLSVTAQHKDQNYYRFENKREGARVFTIPSKDIEKNCAHNCTLTIQVYLDQGVSNELGYSLFDLEVSQQETIIQLGQTKVDYIESQDIFVYEFQKSSQDGVVVIQDNSIESAFQEDCLQVSWGKIGNFVSPGAFPLPANSNVLTLFIMGLSQTCSFKVSYTAVQNPLTAVVQKEHYLFSVNGKQTAFFVYNHNLDEPFRVTTVISNGDIELSAAVVGQNSLQDLINAGSSSFVLTPERNDADLIVQKNSPHLCKGCTYLIAVSSRLGAQGEIVVTKPSIALPLSVKGVIRDKMRVGEIIARNYTFTSISNFNVSLVIFYGELELKVVDSKGKVTKFERIRDIANIPLTVDEKNRNAQTFTICVEASGDASYSIKASRVNVTKRLFSGITEHFSLSKDKNQLLEFSNLQLSLPTFTLLLEVICDNFDSNSTSNINVSVLFSANAEDPTPLEVNRSDAGTAIVLNIPVITGYYFVNVSSAEETNLTAILATSTLLHLRPLQTMVNSKAASYQLYAKNKSIMLDVYSCKGDFSLSASNDFSALSTAAGIDLEQHNYGGHYVIASESISGEYFLKIIPKAGQEGIYRLNYYYYEVEEIFPYKVIDLKSPTITYSISGRSITFSISALTVHDFQNTPIQKFSVTYLFYFANEEQSIISYSNCHIGEASIRLPNGHPPILSNSQPQPSLVKFTLESEDLPQLKDVYFVSAGAEVELIVKEESGIHYPRHLKMIYNPIQVNNHRLQGEYTFKTLALWTILPFVIAGIFLILALRYCIRRYKGMVPDNFVEEAGPSQSGQAVNVEKDVQTNKDTGEAMKHGVI